MLLRKLIEIFRTFDKEELKKFKRFIRSDYFNTNESIVKLFRLIAVFYPDFSPDEKKLSPEALFKGVYGARKYEEKTLRYLISSLYAITEKFLGLTTIEGDELELKKAVIDSLMERGLFSHAEKNLIAAESDLDSSSVISGSYVMNKADYGHLWHQLYFLSNKQIPILEKRIEQAEFLLYTNILEMTHLYQIIRTVSYNYNLEIQPNLVFEYFNVLEQKKFIAFLDKYEGAGHLNEGQKKLYLTLKIYLCFMITMKEPKEEQYFQLMEVLIDKYCDMFDRNEQQNLHVMLTTVCNEKRKCIDDNIYLKKYFDVIKRGVARDLYTSYKSQYLDINNFTMILRTALQLGETEWTEKFLRIYGERISPEYSEDMINYAFAELLFSKNDFEHSLSRLSKVKAKVFRLKVPVRLLMLRLYYELGYLEEAFSMIDSFTRFLTTNKNIRTEEKNSHLKFLSYYKKLLISKADGVNKGNTDLLNTLHAESILHYKSWLINKLKELHHKVT